MTDRELLQQLRDVVATLIRTNNVDDFYEHPELIAAADARLSQPEWTRVEDVLIIRGEFNK